MNMLRRLIAGGVIVVVSWCIYGDAQYENSTYNNCTDGIIDYIGDGWCDSDNNVESCSYDGGDCCPCSCMNGILFECGINGFECVDEGCLDPVVVAQFPDCAGTFLALGDGECDWDNNTPECGYDGGDCCVCTCADNTICTFDFDCINPGAGDELYGCDIPSAVTPPCPEHIEQNWIVEDVYQARALAKAINCSGGSFQVEWRGNISMDETISVVNGTVLRIYGSPDGAVMSGNLEIRLITVINASLYLRGVSMEFGSALVGGAIAASASNMTLNQTSFVSNHAGGMGGALYAIDGSIVSFSGETTTFSHNSAIGSGGAVYVDGDSRVLWKGQKTSFFDNLALVDGGAVMTRGGSTASWNGEVLFSNNFCGQHGGAVNTIDHASVAWDGATVFVNNTCGRLGGAVSIKDNSNVSWRADMTFNQNFAGQNGGGLYVGFNSTLIWSGKTLFDGNKAAFLGGAMMVTYSSISFGSGDMYVQSSSDSGGAVAVDHDSTITWSGKAVFTNNNAGNGIGGAMILGYGSTASWKSDAIFTRNTAFSGGAINVYGNSTAIYEGSTIFRGNIAHSDQGGALSVTSSSLYFSNITTLVGNMAASIGGALAFMAEISPSDRDSLLVVAGPTVFTNNTCEANGGALGLLGGVLVRLDTTDISFSGNRADIAGGAIYMWGNDLGPEFIGVSFVSNFAQHGGGVYSTGSGNALIALDGEQESNPVVFNRCRFVSNQAISTGGAIHSAAGQDLVINTIFDRNMAAEGGALSLAGTSSLLNCSFVENVSDEGQGPAVANIGYVSGISNCSFHGNAFSCERGEFLEYNMSNDLFQTLCNGCEEPCAGCYFERQSKTPFCAKTMDNTHSPGGVISVKHVTIDSGYWRANKFGLEVLPCYNAEACLGGLTGEPGFCLKGYEGPYCAICSKGYSPNLGFTCNKCSNSIGGIVVGVLIALALLVAVILAVSYLLSTELERGTKRACVKQLMRYIPVQSIKIVIVAWQIVVQFASVANVHYPHVYQRFLDGVKLLDFDLGWMLSASCMVDIDFHDRLLFVTPGPIIVLALLGLTYKIAVGKNRQSQRAVQNVQIKHLSAVLLITFLVYAQVSSILFQTFACEYLEDGKLYLRADYRIKCDSVKHKKLQVYAGFMVMIYTVGIPLFYATLLFKDRDVMISSKTRPNNCSGIVTTSSLWEPYKPSVFYFEVIECIRRVALAGVVVFFNPNTASQIAVTLTLTFVFIIISEILDPYLSKWDTWLSRIGHVVVVASVYVALLLRVDVSTERHDSQHTFEVVLLFLNAVMIAAIIIEGLLMACTLECWSRRRQDDNTDPESYPRFRPMRWALGRTPPVEEDVVGPQAIRETV